ncbi:Putative protein of unknown function [Podospora comata]|uniref:C2H2-type domain-containing protein n=1 Tax=Podospora comata TaxID=48703 RepID=A0ABY6SIU5_PODCO|nr:Putative protein of unknown function [Podospora comata]
MEPRGRSPMLSSRVAQKGGSMNICIPLRPRHHDRKTAAADIDLKAQGQDPVDRYSRPAADALSLSGSTPPQSPTMASFGVDGGPKVIISDMMTKPHSRPQLKSMDSRSSLKKAKDQDTAEYQPADKDFRKTHRVVGSIDSILTSTTCVNTASSCSRAESRLSREIRIEVEDADDGEAPILAYHPNLANVFYSESRNHLGVPSRPSSSMTCKKLEEEGELDEDRLIDEISSWVLRNTCGKDVDDCAAPLMIWDCTYRYVQELSSVAQDGTLGIVQATSGQGTPTSQGGGTPGEGGYDQQSSGGYFSKGKRKAEGGGSDDGSGLGGRDHMGGGDDDGDTTMAAQGYTSKNTTNFSCPYRKRNPLRFNVRDHYVCATHSFSDMSQLKKHIRAHHPPVQRNAGPFLCPRCCKGFPSKNDLDSHLRQPEPCRLSVDHGGANPEDGITQKIISSLEARSLKAKIDNWKSLWKLLFPHDREIPEPAFIPVMEAFDFISESEKYKDQLKELLELQYRHVLDGATHIGDIDMKIHQGLKRSIKSIYNWIETVVQDWEKKISGAVSFFNVNPVENTVVDVSDTASWAPSGQRLTPSPASTPTMLSGSTGMVSTMAGTTLVGTESPGRGAPSAAARRRPNPVKRIKRAEVLPKTQPTTQIPVPIQRARTPQGQARTINTSFRPPSVLPSQSALMPASTSGQMEQPIVAFQHPNWDSPPVSMPANYAIPYTTAGDMFQSPDLITAPAHYSPVPIGPSHLEVQNYLANQEHQGAVHVPTGEGLQQHDMVPRPQSTATIRASRLITPRSSVASTWMRDENRDSAQTLVEDHPPGRCNNMYCPSCSKPLPDDMGVTMHVQSPIGMHHGVVGPGHPHQQQHRHQLHQQQQPHEIYGQGGHTTIPGFTPTTGPMEIHGLPGNEEVEWGFHGGANPNMFGGHGGPQEGY